MMTGRPKMLRSVAANHYIAITEARRAGYTWKEIGQALGMRPKQVRDAYIRASRAIEAGRLRAGDSPLPGIKKESPKETLDPNQPQVKKPGLIRIDPSNPFSS